MANSPTGDSVLTRLDRVLSTFSAAESLLSAAEIARRTGLPPATAHRLCRDMAELGWLESLPAGYMVGTRLWEMTNRSAPTMKLAVRARPYLTDVHAVMGQHVQLGVIEGREVLFVDRLSAREAPSIHGGVAGRLPLHVSATGLVLLAHAPSEFRTFYRTQHQDAAGGQIISEDRLEQVRQQGYCAQTGVIEREVTGVAVPIRQRGRSVVAALGVVTDDDDVARRPAPWVQMLQIAARGIQREISGRS
ncbi:IclR family transcriptional regulator [Nesterenkonia sandarakina]|uniref:DNA-binding IclR family transcriptional regulator n=1 Tax=Nesterenkonia sandarakina TaxID=272918 RepID=A0A7Z0E7K0_9MICC|nr:IclR family transcriptional regulator [Nesterenkonia sandarakina]NYJ16060.1 DNA-binding IclR family transcriptional regulator [Nesterenkonia sandarakina]